MFSWLKKETVLTPDRQLKELKKLGIEPRPGIQNSHFLKFRDDVYIDKPYLLVLLALGGEAKPGESYSRQVLHLKDDSIYRSGDYTKLAGRLSELADGELPVHGGSDSIDWGEGTASLEFLLGEERIHFSLRQEGHAPDPAVLTGFAQLLRQRGSAKRFMFIRLRERDKLVLCGTEEQYKRLAVLTGLDLEWLQLS